MGIITLFLEHLTKNQRKKWEGFLAQYPEFYKTLDITLRSKDYAVAFGCHSYTVLRDLYRMAHRFPRLRLQIMYEDSRCRLVPATPEDEDAYKKGGRARFSSEKKGFEGKSRWIRVVLDRQNFDQQQRRN